MAELPGICLGEEVLLKAAPAAGPCTAGGAGLPYRLHPPRAIETEALGHFPTP